MPIWAVAAQETLPRLSSQAFFIDDKESEVCAVFTFVLSAAEMDLIEFVNLVYLVALEWRCADVFGTGSEFTQSLNRIDGSNLGPKNIIFLSKFIELVKVLRRSVSG